MLVKDLTRNPESYLSFLRLDANVKQLTQEYNQQSETIAEEIKLLKRKQKKMVSTIVSFVSLYGHLDTLRKLSCNDRFVFKKK